MEAFLSIALTIVISYILYRYKRKKKEKQLALYHISNSKGYGKLQEEPVTLGAKTLCIQTLRELNCEVEFDEEQEDRIYFNYQGENFFIEATNTCSTFDIWDTGWYEVSLDDIDLLSMVRKAINLVNIYSENTLVYTIDEEDNSLMVHTKRSCFMDKQMPDNKIYMKAMLKTFFLAQRRLFRMLDDIRKEEKINS